MEEKEKTVGAEVLVLNNLRHNIKRVQVHILGDDYYNDALDVYKCDELLCDDLIDAYDDMRKEIRTLTVLMLVMFFMCMALLYMGINHLWIF